jgi:hypothetical protein
MKLKYLIASCLLAAVSLGSCKKEVDNIYNMFDDVKVTFHATSPNAVTDYRTYNEGDEIVIEYTITSAKEDMTAIRVTRDALTPEIVQTVTLTPTDDKRSYSGVLKFNATRTGLSTYRIYALNKQQVYIGDGYTKVTVNVPPNFNYVTQRNLYLPDSVANSTSASYYSIKLGKAFTYEEAKAVSADIDFAIYRSVPPAGTNISNTIDGYWYHIYSPAATTLPFTVYDLSTWTKRTTKFSLPMNEPNQFRDNLISGLQIGTYVGAKSVTLDQTPKTQAGHIRLGYVVYFKTPENKLGAIHFRQITTDINGRWYASIFVKVQK